MRLRQPIYESRPAEFKGVGFHYNWFWSWDYAWRYQKRGSPLGFSPKIARISLKLRNLG